MQSSYPFLLFLTHTTLKLFLLRTPTISILPNPKISLLFSPYSSSAAFDPTGYSLMKNFLHIASAILHSPLFPLVLLDTLFSLICKICLLFQTVYRPSRGWFSSNLSIILPIDISNRCYHLLNLGVPPLK